MVRNEIEYSEKVEGNRGNYNRFVRFDDQDTYLGIVQSGDNEHMVRVLMSAQQVEALIAFWRKWHAAPRRKRKVHHAR